MDKDRILTYFFSTFTFTFWGFSIKFLYSYVALILAMFNKKIIFRILFSRQIFIEKAKTFRIKFSLCLVPHLLPLPLPPWNLELNPEDLHLVFVFSLYWNSKFWRQRLFMWCILFLVKNDLIQTKGLAYLAKSAKNLKTSKSANNEMTKVCSTFSVRNSKHP